MFTKTFENAKPNDDGRRDFSACNEAERWLADRGYSVGSMQRGEPRGILFGDYAIAKWRNLTAKERKELDGTMVGKMREGPVTVVLIHHDSEPAPL